MYLKQPKRGENGANGAYVRYVRYACFCLILRVFRVWFTLGTFRARDLILVSLGTKLMMDLKWLIWCSIRFTPDPGPNGLFMKCLKIGRAISFLTGSVGYAKVSLMALALQIKNIIRKEMESRGISKRDLAKLLGCTEENVYQIMSDGKGMKTVIADKIFRVLGLEVIVEIREK